MCNFWTGQTAPKGLLDDQILAYGPWDKCRKVLFVVYFLCSFYIAHSFVFKRAHSIQCVCVWLILLNLVSNFPDFDVWVFGSNFENLVAKILSQICLTVFNSFITMILSILRRILTWHAQCSKSQTITIKAPVEAKKNSTIGKCSCK